jgi:predicted nucleotidyltransferase
MVKRVAKKQMFILVLIIIAVATVIVVFHRPDLRFIMENTWNQFCLSAELEKVNFNKNSLQAISVSDIKNGKTDIICNNTLCLVNNEYPIGEELSFKLVNYRDTGVLMDESLAESYAKLSADVKRHLDEDLFVMSHYRTEEEQKNLYEKDKIGLFGSFALNEQSKKSDIDLLVVFMPGKKTFDNYMGLKFFLEDLLEKPIDLVIAEAVKPALKDHIEGSVIFAQGV